VTAKNLGSISRRGFSLEDSSQAHVRALLQDTANGQLSLRQLDSTDLEGSDRVEVMR
jgi:hypothetical protein